MKFSFSLYKNIMKATVGGLAYKFKIKSRRHVLFFHEIFIEYLKECLKIGYKNELRLIGVKWGYLIMSELLPPGFKRLPKSIVLNSIMKKIWSNLGLIEDYRVEIKDNNIFVYTLNEVTTKSAGPNELMVGFHEGILSGLFGCQITCKSASQGHEICEYVFELRNTYFKLESKGKSTYDKLNRYLEIEGFTLKDALKNSIFQLKEKNKIYFRGKEVYPIENTLFPLLGNSNILMDKLSYISYNFFKEIIDPTPSIEQKLSLIKTLLQCMGWGLIQITLKENEIIFEIKYPPYGLQFEKDNWNFILKVILGYLWLINKKFKIQKLKERTQKLVVTYSIG